MMFDGVFFSMYNLQLTMSNCGISLIINIQFTMYNVQFTIVNRISSFLR